MEKDVLKDLILSKNKRPILILSLTENTWERGLELIKKNMVKCAELRGDLFYDRERLKDAVKKLKNAGASVVLTLRHVSEGGRIEDEERIPLFLNLIDEACAFDIEVLRVKEISTVVSKIQEREKNIIFSYHNFTKTPEMEEIERVFRLVPVYPFKIFKIATRVRDLDDVKTLTRFLLLHEGENLTVVGMGEAGRMTRILFPALGSLLIYVNAGEETAEGQLTLEETVDFLNKMNLKLF